jgi:hypothetical protein
MRLHQGDLASLGKSNGFFDLAAAGKRRPLPRRTLLRWANLVIALPPIAL